MCYVMQLVCGVRFPEKKHFKGIRFNVISVTRRWVGVEFPDKKCYVILEWLLRSARSYTHPMHYATLE